MASQRRCHAVLVSEPLLIHGEVLLGYEPAEHVVHFRLSWQARPLAKVVEVHLYIVVSLVEVVAGGDVDGVDRLPVNMDPALFISDGLSYPAC